MRHKTVAVELYRTQPVRIFRSHSAAAGALRKGESGPVVQMTPADAVHAIRHSLFVRSGGFCELCANPIIEKTAHMHEQVHRGKGGEISLDNSVFICATCHHRAHADRNPRFTKKPLTSE